MIPYKDDNPTRTIPFVTIGIISANILMFIWQIFSEGSLQGSVFTYGAVPHNMITLETKQPINPVLTVFTAMFMHGGFLHLAFNMLYLWIFGNNIEDKLGHVRFSIFYLFCGIVAAYAHAVTEPRSHIPMVGASGAVSGVLGAYILLFPRATVHTIVILGFFITTVKIPALIVIGFWAIIQFVNGLLSTSVYHKGGVAWFAHIGGFLIGLLTIKLWLPRRNKRWL